MKKRILFSFLFLASMANLSAQPGNNWKNKKCAVVITYDDAISQHLDNAIPVLDSLGLKATFYITAFSKACQQRLPEWKKIAANGHELGNHTLFHPCAANLPGRTWVRPEYDLSTYSVGRMLDEVRMTNLFLNSLDGKTKRTFAFTCGDMKIGDTLFINYLKDDFVAARAVRNEMHTIGQVDLFNMDCYLVDNHTGAQMIDWVKKAMDSGTLLVILFHGVNGGNALDVSLSAHRELLQYLKRNEKDIWIAPLLDVAEYISAWQKGH